MLVTRRGFARILLVLPVASCGEKFARSPLAEEDPEDVPLLPCSPRRMTDAEMDALWSFYAEIGRNWSMPADSRESFDAILQAKAAEAPSYASEYDAMVRMLRTGGAKGTLAQLIDPTRRSQRLGDVHARRFVLEEFAALLIAGGGLKSCGAAQLPGYWWVGGPDSYRRLEGVTL